MRQALISGALCGSTVLLAYHMGFGAMSWELWAMVAIVFLSIFNSMAD